VARAGLLAELGKRPVPGPKAVRRVDMRPGEHPLRELALKLLLLATEPTSLPDIGAQRKLIDDLGQPNKQQAFDGLTLWAANQPDATACPLVLLVDQFEEVYTQCKDPAERDAFVALLLHAASDGSRQVTVVIALRSDFLGETQQHHSDLSGLIAENHILVPPMSTKELREAIEKPAEEAGRALDEATVDRLLTEVRGNAGALPLLEFALARIWDGAVAGTQPGDTLMAIGGVGGALSGKAREIYGALSKSEQVTAKRALVRLVQLGEGTRDTRRRVLISELCGRHQTTAEVLAVLRKVASEKARLITLAGDTAAPTAEVTHEALFDHWAELRDWIDQSRVDRRFYDRAAESARLWHHAGRPAGRLWRRPDLDLLRDYEKRQPDELGPVLTDFLAASLRQQQRDKLLAYGAVTAVITALLMAGTIYLIKERQRTQEQNLRLAESKTQGEKIRQQLLSTYVERGRQFLLQDRNINDALPWLHRAQQAGSTEPVLPDLMGDAMRSASRVKAVLLNTPGVVVHRARYSPDGRRIVTASEDHTARVWDAETGRLLIELKGQHQQAVHSASYSSDGRRIVTASEDHTAQVWDADTGRSLTTLKGHTERVFSANYSPDGRRIITASWDHTARIWDANTGILLKELKGHTQPIISANYSPDGHRVVTASWDHTARVWDAETGHLFAELKGPTPFRAVLYASYSPDGRRIVTASEDHTARVWDADTGRWLMDLKGHTERVISASYSPDGRCIVTSSGDHTARIWDANTGRLLSSLLGHTERVFSASYSPDGRRIVTTSGDHTARIWSADIEPFLFELKGHTGRVFSASYSPDGHRIVTASEDNTARVWNADTGHLLTELKGHTQSVSSANYSPNSRRIVTTSNDRAWVWDADTGRFLLELKDKYDSTINSASYSPDGHHIIIVTGDSWTRFAAEAGVVISDGFLSSREDPVARFRNEDSVASANLSSDGHRIVAGFREGGVGIWDVDSERSLTRLSGHTKQVLSTNYSPDGRRIVTASEDKSARIWDANNGRLLKELKGHTERVYCARYSPDGRRIVTASGDRTARIWDANTARLLSELKGHSKEVLSASYSPDGRRIVTTSGDGTARVWDATPNGLGEPEIGNFLRCFWDLRFDNEDSDVLVPNEPKNSACVSESAVATSTRVVSVASVQPSPTASSGIKQHVENVLHRDSSNCEIDKKLLDQTLGSKMGPTDARIVPYFIETRKQAGWKIYNLKPDSLFSKIGLQNADQIKSINDIDVSHLDVDLNKVYSIIKDSSRLIITVTRRGENIELICRIL
jgi:WD40 repeat protein